MTERACLAFPFHRYFEIKQVYKIGYFDPIKLFIQDDTWIVERLTDSILIILLIILIRGKWNPSKVLKNSTKFEKLAILGYFWTI